MIDEPSTLNEFERALLHELRTLNGYVKSLDASVKALENIPAAVAEQGKTLGSLLKSVHDLGRRPNVISLTNRVKEVEGEVSSIEGRVLHLEAKIGAAG